MVTHQLVLTAVFATGFSWHVEGSQGRAAFNLAMRMDNVNHARLLVPAAKLALLFSDVVEPGACLTILSRTDPDHDSAAASHFCFHRRLPKQGFTGCLYSLSTRMTATWNCHTLQRQFVFLSLTADAL